MLDNTFLFFFIYQSIRRRTDGPLKQKTKRNIFFSPRLIYKIYFLCSSEVNFTICKIILVLCGEKTSAPAAEWTRHSRHWTVIRRGRIRYEEFWVFSKAFISLFFAKKKKLNKGLHVIKASFPDGHPNNGRSSTLIDPK